MVVELFVESLKRAMSQELSGVELLGIAGQLGAAGENKLVISLYQTWLDHNPEDPLRCAIHFNLGVILANQNDIAAAKAAYEEAIRIKPEFFPPYINLGNVYEKMGSLPNALQSWTFVVNKLPMITSETIGYKLTALQQISRVYETADIDEQAEETMRLSLDINPNQSEMLQHYLSMRQRQMKWPVVLPFSRVTRDQLMRGFSPLTAAAYSDDPLFQLANACRLVREDVGEPRINFLDSHEALKNRDPSAPIRVGYFSSDMRGHVVGYMIVELFELHDPAKVELHAYYNNPSPPDALHERFRKAARLVDITHMSDEQAARQIVEDKIEILVDLNGHTQGSRMKMLAMRPAPIVVNWFGFPGTAGSPFHHYILADDFIVPKGSEHYYSEKVARLPCYQPNDRHRRASDQVYTRQDAGLPEDAVVFCCFNGRHKISRFTWQRWMEIMRQVPGSVLWLLEGVETTSVRLKQHMADHGIDPERLIFAKKMSNPDHLKRIPLADLFLDSIPYGAHATASDALWAGVPVLTLVGKCHAARVCGSLLHAVGLPELACATPEEFVNLAVSLAKDRERLQSYRQKLLASRDSCVLFDVATQTRKLEGLFAEMVQEFRQGTLHRPNLTNLETYLDIGVGLDRDDVETGLLANYEEYYREQLAFKDRLSALPPDGRLWPGRG